MEFVYFYRSVTECSSGEFLTPASIPCVLPCQPAHTAGPPPKSDRTSKSRKLSSVWPWLLCSHRAHQLTRRRNPTLPSHPTQHTPAKKVTVNFLMHKSNKKIQIAASKNIFSNSVFFPPFDWLTLLLTSGSCNSTQHLSANLLANCCCTVCRNSAKNMEYITRMTQIPHTAECSSCAYQWSLNVIAQYIWASHTTAILHCAMHTAQWARSIMHGCYKINLSLHFPF